MERASSARWLASLPTHHHPPECPSLMAPRLIELCFQTAGLWEMACKAAWACRCTSTGVCLRRSPDLADGPLYAVVTPDPDGGSFDADVVDTAGNRYAQVTGYRTVALPGVVDAEPLKVSRRNGVMSHVGGPSGRGRPPGR